MKEIKLLVTFKFEDGDFEAIAHEQGLSTEQVTDEVFAGWIKEDMLADEFNVDSVVPA